MKRRYIVPAIETEEIIIDGHLLLNLSQGADVDIDPVPTDETLDAEGKDNWWDFGL